jgi:hypothetical protein
MIKEKRKKLRRVLRYAAFIGTGADMPLRGCMVSDISETGAKLDVENAEELPGEFQLLLSGRGGIYRQCYAIWRTSNQIGVHFERVAEPAPSKVPPPRPAT